MEHEIMMTGVGGQGVQLASQILARSAVVENREVMTLGTYGGTMRGGNTDSVLVVGDGPIHSPPIVAQVGNALAMHHAFFAPVAKKLRPGALVLLNSTVFEGEVEGQSFSYRGHWIAFHLLEHDIHHRSDIFHYLALLKIEHPDVGTP